VLDTLTIKHGMNFELMHPRDKIEQVMERVYSGEMTTTSGGNVSVRDGEESVWITPARLDKGRLRAADIVQIGMDGESLCGAHRPSSEYPFHLSIYRERPDIRAVIHAHPGALVSFSISGKVPDTGVFPEARRICGRVGLAPYALPGSEELGKKIAMAFAVPGTWCVILENHGVVVGGHSLEEAFKRFETLEFTAQTLIEAGRLGGARILSDERLAIAAGSAGNLKHCVFSQGGSREGELRKEICDFIGRAYRHRLVTSTWGSLSARLDKTGFLITPYGKDRQHLTLEDLVLVRNGQCSSGSQPSRVVHLHQAIYETHPEVEAIINALPIHTTAFSVSDLDIETRTIPESYVFLRDVSRIPYETVYTRPELVAKCVGPERPVALLEHNGALVAGKSVLDAFDRLEVLESTAKALITASVFGPIRPMPDAVIEELRIAFDLGD
jgi:L-fuculose-phosphate aldolase